MSLFVAHWPRWLMRWCTGLNSVERGVKQSERSSDDEDECNLMKPRLLLEDFLCALHLQSSITMARSQKRGIKSCQGWCWRRRTVVVLFGVEQVFPRFVWYDLISVVHEYVSRSRSLSLFKWQNHASTHLVLLSSYRLNWIGVSDTLIIIITQVTEPPVPHHSLFVSGGGAVG